MHRSSLLQSYTHHTPFRAHGRPPMQVQRLQSEACSCSASASHGGAARRDVLLQGVLATAVLCAFDLEKPEPSLAIGCEPSWLAFTASHWFPEHAGPCLAVSVRFTCHTAVVWSCRFKKELKKRKVAAEEYTELGAQCMDQCCTPDAWHGCISHKFWPWAWPQAELCTSHRGRPEGV